MFLLFATLCKRRGWVSGYWGGDGGVLHRNVRADDEVGRQAESGEDKRGPGQLFKTWLWGWYVAEAMDGGGFKEFFENFHRSLCSVRAWYWLCQITKCSTNKCWKFFLSKRHFPSWTTTTYRWKNKNASLGSAIQVFNSSPILLRLQTDIDIDQVKYQQFFGYIGTYSLHQCSGLVFRMPKTLVHVYCREIGNYIEFCSTPERKSQLKCFPC